MLFALNLHRKHIRRYTAEPPSRTGCADGGDLGVLDGWYIGGGLPQFGGGFCEKSGNGVVEVCGNG